MKNLKISEIAKLSGVSVKALRIYEEKGLLAPVRQYESNYRLYAEEDISRIKNIKSLQGLGFSLKEISIIRRTKELQNEDLRSIFLNQLNGTISKIADLEDRKLTLQNIIQKIEEDKINPSSILTAKEKDVFMGITTGFTKLDKLLKEESKDQLIVIAARPGMGKTALTVHIANSLMDQTNKPIVFYSTEFDHREWTKRLAVQLCEIDRDIENLDEGDKERYEETYIKLQKKPIYYHYNKDIPLEGIKKHTSEIKKDLGAVVIDHLQDITGEDAEKCIKLKELSKQLNCPVLVISTVSKIADTRPLRKPIPKDVNNYSSMVGHVDKLLIVSREGNGSLAGGKGIVNIHVYNDDLKSSDHINLVWDGTYCGYSDSL